MGQTSSQLVGSQLPATFESQDSSYEENFSPKPSRPSMPTKKRARPSGEHDNEDRVQRKARKIGHSQEPGMKRKRKGRASIPQHRRGTAIMPSQDSVATTPVQDTERDHHKENGVDSDVHEDDVRMGSINDSGGLKYRMSKIKSQTPEREESSVEPSALPDDQSTDEPLISENYEGEYQEFAQAVEHETNPQLRELMVDHYFAEDEDGVILGMSGVEEARRMWQRQHSDGGKGVDTQAIPETFAGSRQQTGSDRPMSQSPSVLSASDDQRDIVLNGTVHPPAMSERRSTSTSSSASRCVTPTSKNAYQPPAADSPEPAPAGRIPTPPSSRPNGVSRSRDDETTPTQRSEPTDTLISAMESPLAESPTGSKASTPTSSPAPSERSTPKQASAKSSARAALRSASRKKSRSAQKWTTVNEPHELGEAMDEGDQDDKDDEYAVPLSEEEPEGEAEGAPEKEHQSAQQADGETKKKKSKAKSGKPRKSDAERTRPPARKIHKDDVIKGAWSFQEKDLADAVFESCCAELNLTSMELAWKITEWNEVGLFRDRMHEAFPFRLAGSIRKLCQRRYHPFSTGAWTPEEDESLKSTISELGLVWSRISFLVNRPPEACRDRWKNIVQYEATMESGPWSLEEEATLLEVVDELLDLIWEECEDVQIRNDPERLETMIDWRTVAKKLNETRSAKRCYEKWKKLKRRADTVNKSPVKVERPDPLEVRKRLDRTYRKIGWGNVYDALVEICDATAGEPERTYEYDSTFWSIEMFAMFRADAELQAATAMGSQAIILRDRLWQLNEQGRLEWTRVSFEQSTQQDEEEGRQGSQATSDSPRTKTPAKRGKRGSRASRSQSARTATVPLPEAGEQDSGEIMNADQHPIEEPATSHDVDALEIQETPADSGGAGDIKAGGSINDWEDTESLGNVTPSLGPRTFMNRCRTSITG
ncbi:hypothetical protein BDY17DRAFT_3914 [Neohortaea acidophila]|uniref:Myb-like DNA-binding domain-containing protein n=1 Tax=Neohortaea acidophila TaxID=245834 RepID=A0A6A6Q4C0_9PEZI|nr:uncharacterized protein BDY17DRAFT_3914 [Neohortaea acidophila]KAF2487132.1 hypothetical protein BDY17DRAFT_3914 [Neohortaea acidophila]